MSQRIPIEIQELAPWQHVTFSDQIWAVYVYLYEHPAVTFLDIKCEMGFRSSDVLDLCLRALVSAGVARKYADLVDLAHGSDTRYFMVTKMGVEYLDKMFDLIPPKRSWDPPV